MTVVSCQFLSKEENGTSLRQWVSSEYRRRGIKVGEYKRVGSKESVEVESLLVRCEGVRGIGGRVGGGRLPSVWFERDGITSGAETGIVG